MNPESITDIYAFYKQVSQYMFKANLLEKVHLLRWKLYKYSIKIPACSNYMPTSVLVQAFRVFFCISS